MLFYKCCIYIQLNSQNCTKDLPGSIIGWLFILQQLFMPFVGKQVQQAFLPVYIGENQLHQSLPYALLAGMHNYLHLCDFWLQVVL